MYKQIGSIFLVAGTCIGSGMIALPMVLAKLGLVPSIALMLIIWSVMYYTSLVNLELNLQASKGLSLGKLGEYFSGRIAKIIGLVSLKLLSYSLLAVFIYGGCSILQKLLNLTISISEIASYYSIIATLVLLLPITLIDYINRILFTLLLFVFTILVAGLVAMITWNNLPLFSDNYADISIWRAVIPVVFTSFGFQVIFHTLTNYCNKDARILKKIFFLGSLIPAIIYIIWTTSVLSVVHHENNNFYHQIMNEAIDVGDLIKELSSIARWQYVQLMVWWISLLAIITSILGVGVGLCDSLKNNLVEDIIPNQLLRKLLAAIITIWPAYIIIALVPNAFVTVLGFAGMILAIIAILLPIYLLYQIKAVKYNYSELNKKYLIIGSVITGIIVISCEVVNIIT